MLFEDETDKMKKNTSNFVSRVSFPLTFLKVYFVMSRSFANRTFHQKKKKTSPPSFCVTLSDIPMNGLWNGTQKKFFLTAKGIPTMDVKTQFDGQL